MTDDAHNWAAMRTYPLILLLRRPILLLDGVLKLRVGPVEEDLGALAGDQQALHLGPSTLSHSHCLSARRLTPRSWSWNGSIQGIRSKTNRNAHG